jgi:biotin carboxyl carrier protein
LSQEKYGGAPAPAAPAGAADAPARFGDDGALWAGFTGPRSAGEFCESWLALQCRELKSASAGLLLLREEDGRFTPAAVWPDRKTDVRRLAAPAREALALRSGHVARDGAQVHVSYPLEASGILQGVVVVELEGLSGDEVVAALRRLHWGAGWLETLFRRRDAQRDQERLARSDLTLGMLARAAEHERSRESATAVATHLATELGCSRVSLGILRRRSVKLAAISHQASFEERAQVIDAIENAMEEALDQDSSVVHPATAATERRIAFAHQELARKGGTQAVLTVPLVSAGGSVGALTLERDGGKPFTDADIAAMEAVGAALGPLVEARGRSERLLAGKAVDATRDWTHKLVGPRRPGLKLAALAALAAVAFLALARDEFRVNAKTVIEGTVQRSAAAPFDGFVASAPVRAGQQVEENQVLASLDLRDINLEAARWRAERDQQSLRYQEALGKQDRVQARIFAAQLRQAEAQLALLETKAERAVIRAPFAGVVVSGDLSQQIGGPVETGKVLFEIAPLDSYRAVLQVEERDFAYVKPGQRGALRLAGQASVPVAFTVASVVPVATSGDGRNTFRVEAHLDDGPGWVRPGMEGVAKVAIEDRPLIWVWTRTLVDWVRLQAWAWLP